jgi:hypothetical protein
VRGRTSQVEVSERPIEVDRGREALHLRVGSAFETTSPELSRSFTGSGARPGRFFRFVVCHTRKSR